MNIIIKAIQKLVIIIGIITFFGFKNNPHNHKGSTPFRGFMIDAPRTVETMEYYFRLIDFCHNEGLNSIIFRITDDQGSAYYFKSHPELKTCRGAFKTQELKKLVKYADGKGIEMIPEIESFGHAKYIIETQRYKFLDDGDQGKDFNSVSPVSDSTLQLMKDLYTEITAIFTSRYLHIGCDEVNWGHGEMSRKALETNTKSRIWAGYVNKLNEYVKSLGRKAIIWGDVPIYHDKEVLDLLGRDIVIMDWNYWETDKSRVDSVVRTILSKGFQVIGCPALNWCRWGPRMGNAQFENIKAYAEVYGNLSSDNNLGIFLSNWVPMRYLQNSQWDTYTIAAKILTHRGNYQYMDALPEFVKNHFGVDWDEGWKRIYHVAYERAPQSFCAQNDSLRLLPWSDREDIKAILARNVPLENPFVEIKDLLFHYQHRIKRNKADFDDLRLSIQFLEYICNRQNNLLAFADARKTDIKSIETYLDRTSAEDSLFISRINSAWRRGRRSEPGEKKTEKDYMMSFYLASEYSKKLRDHPVELLEILSP